MPLIDAAEGSVAGPMTEHTRREAIPAVRGWSVRWYPATGARLESLVVPYRWYGPVERTDHPVVHPPAWPPVEARPEVGFYACTPDEAYAALEPYRMLDCVGTVSLFGRVVEHERGYRAEVVRIDRLWLVEGPAITHGELEAPDLARELGREYRCPVAVSEDLRDAVDACRRRVETRSKT